MSRDFRVALRLLLRARGYTAAIVTVLTLAVGANTAIFSIVYGVLLKPLLIRDPGRLVIVWDSDTARNLRVVELSYRTFEHWAEHSRSFASTAVIGSSAWRGILKGRGAPVRLASCGVSASFFNTIGAVPLLGRPLRPEDDLPNAPAVAVLSYTSWVQYFGADPRAVGSTVEFDTTRTIVGVMPPEFDFPQGTSFWFPVVPLLAGVSRSGFDAFASVGVLFVIGRLQPGITPRLAAEELDGLSRSVAGAPPPPRFGSAGLVVRSFVALRRLDPGFVPSNVLTMFVLQSNEEIRDLLGRIEALPQIQAAGAVYLRPLELGAVGQEITARLEGQTEAAARANPTLNFQVATPGYFRAMRIRLLHGRFFSDQDRADSVPVALVGETAARRLWPGQNAVGKRILLFDRDKWATVAGVVGDVHYRGLGDPRLDVYEPESQSRSQANYLAIRTTGDPLTVAAAVQMEVRRVNPAVVVDSIVTLDAIVSRAVAPWRFTSWLLMLLASLAFVLTAVGLFSLVSLETSTRRQELAIRLAVGAQRSDLLGAVMVPAALHGLAGLVAGALAGIAVTRALRGLLFRVETLDPATWAAVLATVILMVGLAAYLPARRAAAVDPLVLLRR